MLINKYMKSTTDPSSLIILWMLCLVWKALTFCTLRSVCIFFILFSVHLKWYWQGSCVEQSRVSWVGGHLLYSYNLILFDLVVVMYREIRCQLLPGVILRVKHLHGWLTGSPIGMMNWAHSSLESKPDRAILFHSSASHCSLTMPLPTQEHQWIPLTCHGNMTEYFASNHLYSWKERRTVRLIYLSQD